jgi:hypothetical protein
LTSIDSNLCVYTYYITNLNLHRDIHNIDNIQIVTNELTISAVVSSLARQGVCPNFVLLHGVFTCAYEPPALHWGCETKKHPKGVKYNQKKVPCQLKPPGIGDPGRFQYIRMELINEGDSEELIKRQENQLFPAEIARNLLFQVAFALFVAAEKFSVKHYDVKLLNIFIQDSHTTGGLVLRYGLGSHVFALKMPPRFAYVAKLADFGTANMVPATNGLPVAISHFTTLENTPPDYLILGDQAQQGHQHDNFGLGLVMLHLFTGFGPYEEILDDVKCPRHLKRRLQLIWEDETTGYSVIRSLIFDGVDVDEYGNVEGDRDETLYDTLYRYLVLFGIPEVKFQEKIGCKIWNAIYDSLLPPSWKATKPNESRHKMVKSDSTTYKRDCKKYSIRTGNNKYIARARQALLSINGGIELLFGLCNFDPSVRSTSMDVLNSKFMEDLHEEPGTCYTQSINNEDFDVRSYLSFLTSTSSI